MRSELEEKQERDRVIVDHSLVWPLIYKLVRLRKPPPEHIHFIVPYAATQQFDNWTFRQARYVQERLEDAEVSYFLFELSVDAEEMGRTLGSTLPAEELNALLLRNLHRIGEDRRIWALFLSELTVAAIRLLTPEMRRTPGADPQSYYHAILRAGLPRIRGIGSSGYANWNELRSFAKGKGKGNSISTLPEVGFTDGNATPHDVYITCADHVRVEAPFIRPVYLDTRDTYWDSHTGILFETQGMVVRNCAPYSPRDDIRQCRRPRPEDAHMWQRSAAKAKDKFNITYVTEGKHIVGGDPIGQCPALNLFKGRCLENNRGDNRDEGACCWLN